MAGRVEEVVTWLDDWLECGDAKLDSSGDVVSESAAVKAKDALEGSQGCVSDDSRVDARCQECREMTLLIAASMGGQKALVAHLLERCRSTPARLKMIGMRDADGYTALMWAAERGEFGVVAALLKAGALTDPPWPSRAELHASPSPEAPLASEAGVVSSKAGVVLGWFRRRLGRFRRRPGRFRRRPGWFRRRPVRFRRRQPSR